MKTQEQIETWLRTSNGAFGGATPLEVISAHGSQGAREVAWEMQQRELDASEVAEKTVTDAKRKWPTLEDRLKHLLKSREEGLIQLAQTNQLSPSAQRELDKIMEKVRKGRTQLATTSVAGVSGRFFAGQIPGTVCFVPRSLIKNGRLDEGRYVQQGWASFNIKTQSGGAGSHLFPDMTVEPKKT